MLLKLVVQLLDILPIATLYGLYGVLLYIGIVVVYPFYLTYQTLRVQQEDEPVEKSSSKFKQRLSKKLNALVMLLYGTGEENEKLKEFLENENTYRIHNKGDKWKQIQVTWLSVMLRINAISLLLLCGVIVWDIFVIEKSLECDDERHCFLAFDYNWQTFSILNCTNITLNEIPVTCFKFVYNAGDAVGNAGGLLAFGSYTMKFGSRILIFIYSRGCKCCNKRLYRVFIMIAQQALPIILLVLAIIATAFARYRDLSFYGSYVEAFGVASVIALVTATPWCIIAMDGKQLKTKNDDTLTELDEDEQARD